jgi:cytochrome c553
LKLNITRFLSKLTSALANRAWIHAAVMSATCFVAIQQSRAADIDAGRKLVEAQCASCHGKDAKTPIDPTFPKLAGQYDDYLVKVLLDYQSGARKNAVMAGIAKPLSKKDIADISAYLSQLPGPLSHRR